MLTRKVKIIGVILISLLIYSCWSDDINNLSKEIIWEPSVAVPIGKASVGFDSFSGFDTTLLELDTISGYPNWVDTPNIDLNSSMTFNLAGLTEETEEINLLMFRLNFYNGFPVDVKVQGYFINNSESIIDSIFTESALIITAGRVNDNGETVDKTHTQRDITLDKDKINTLSDAQEFKIDIQIPNASLDTNLIEFYPNYSIDIQIGIMADIKLDSININ